MTLYDRTAQSTHAVRATVFGRTYKRLRHIGVEQAVITNEEKWEEGVEWLSVHCDHRGFISSSRAARCARITLPCQAHEQSWWQNEQISNQVGFHQRKAPREKETGRLYLIDATYLRQLWQCNYSERLTAALSTGVLPADRQNF